MSLNLTASAERIHIGFFGLRNAGKSSLVNAVTGQALSLVSDVLGTTTDPVKKAMELLPLGAVVIIDTPGLDDEGELGLQRVAKAKEMLDSIHIGVLVVDATKGFAHLDTQLIELFKLKKIPYIIAYNKADLLSEIPVHTDFEIFVSAKNGTNINELKELIGKFCKTAGNTKSLLGDIVKPLDTVVLVVPIDESAPKGRLILPQQQTIRELLDIGAMAIVCKDTELESTLSSLKSPPQLVITDSQAFGRVSKIVPTDIPLTSFSIIFARYKGDLEVVVKGAKQLEMLKNGDKVLIAEGCTHHRQCNDIGSVKMPSWIKNYTGKELEFIFTSGKEFPIDTSEYSLIVHCGGCMLNEKEMESRQQRSAIHHTPITNYGIAIAQMNGILKRSVEPFPEILKLLK